jgi:hypothetical protein
MIADIVLDGDTQAGGLLGSIRGMKVWHAFYLEGSSEPGWVNLRTIRPTPNRLLLERLDRRLHSMTPDGRIALAAAALSFFTHTRPPAPPSSAA